MNRPVAFIASSVVSLIMIGATYQTITTRASQQADADMNRLRQEVSILPVHLEQTLNRKLALAESLSAFVLAQPNFTETEFQRFATALTQNEEGIISLQLAPGGVVRHVTNRERNLAAIGYDILADQNVREVIEKSIAEHVLIITGPIPLRQGGEGLIKRLPVFLPDADGVEIFWGFATVLVDPQALMDEAGLTEGMPGIEVALATSDEFEGGGRVFFGNEEVFARKHVTLDVTLPRGQWALGAVRTDGPADHPQFVSESGLWAGGLLFALIAGMATFTVLRRPAQLRAQIESATERLTAQLLENQESRARLEEQTTRLQLLAEREATLSKEAKEAQQTLVVAIESIDDGFVLYDDEDRLVLCNEKYREFYPRSASKVKAGMKFEDLLRFGAYNGEYAQAIGREEEWVAERLAIHNQGDRTIEQELSNGRWLRIAERKAPNGYRVGFRVDITELKKAQSQAEAASEAKSSFLASMSHEIRTPMTAITGFADILLNEKLSQSSRARVRQIKDSAQWLLQILNDILDISKLDAGKLEIEAINTDLSTLIKDVVAMFQETLPPEKQGRLAISTKIDPSIPPLISSDPTRLRQVLVNLLGNAVKFTEDGHITVSCQLTFDASMIEIAVEDTGIGIRDDVIPTLFDDFSQADPSISRRFQGTGLGLAICRRLAALMEGEIGVESAVGEGSKFTFSFYFTEAVGDTPQPAEAANEPQGLAPMDGRPLSLLVAEDNVVNRMLIGEILDAWGHKAVFAENGQEALELAQAEIFDVVLMDVRMPVLSGVDATQKIRELAPPHGAVPIIALTADLMEETVAECRSAGMTDCIGKPIDLAVLAKVLETVTTKEEA